MKAVVANFNQDKALLGAFFKLREGSFSALFGTHFKFTFQISVWSEDDVTPTVRCPPPADTRDRDENEEARQQSQR